MDFAYIVATVLFFWLSWGGVRFCDVMNSSRVEVPREEPK
jgi:hypothetical protein